MVQSVEFNSIKKFKVILSATHQTSPIFQIGKKKISEKIQMLQIK